MDSPSLRGLSILIVEDEPLIALDLALILQREGAQVTTTQTLRQALVLVEHDGLAAAILDRALGNGDCQELCGRLVARGIPFMIYSGFPAQGGACERGLYLAKPAHPATIVDAMVRVLREHRSGC